MKRFLNAMCLIFIAAPVILFLMIVIVVVEFVLRLADKTSKPAPLDYDVLFHTAGGSINLDEHEAALMYE